MNKLKLLKVPPMVNNKKDSLDASDVDTHGYIGHHMDDDMDDEYDGNASQHSSNLYRSEGNLNNCGAFDDLNTTVGDTRLTYLQEESSEEEALDTKHATSTVTTPQADEANDDINIISKLVLSVCD